MIWVGFLTRQGRKLQLPFMCCLAPFPGGIAPFPALSFSSGTGSAAPGDQTERCGSGRGNAKARVNVPLSPSPTNPGARPSGRRQASQFCPCPADQTRGGRGETRGSRQAGSGRRCRLPPRLQPAPHAQETNVGGDVARRNSAKPRCETDPGSPGGAAARPRGLGAPRTCWGPPEEARPEQGRGPGPGTELREGTGGGEGGCGEPRGGGDGRERCPAPVPGGSGLSPQWGTERSRTALRARRALIDGSALPGREHGGPAARDAPGVWVFLPHSG